MTASSTPLQDIHEAYRALRLGDRPAAQRLAQQAAEKAPELEDPWLILAASAEPEESVAYLKHALEIDPASPRARKGMHWAVQRLRRKQIAEIKFTAPPAKSAAVNGVLVEAAPTVDSGQGVVIPRPTGTFRRVFGFACIKAITLFLTLAVGLYLFILIINLGGYVDKVFSAYIDESIGAMIRGGWLRDTPEPERTQIIDQTRWDMQEAMGLHQPFVVRSFRWLLRGLTFDLGQSVFIYFQYSESGSVRQIILQRIPYTLLLTGLTSLLVFVSSILTALFLSRRPGNFLDRLSVFLAPLTSAPSWIIGIILVAIFAGWLRILPYPKVLPFNERGFYPEYLAVVGRYMILPALAIFIGAFFQGVYSWRTFFLISANEDYVELARANGLPRGLIERRHILRPVLPYVITSFATMMLLVWQASMALELLFRWPGIGLLFLEGVRSISTALSLGVVVVFAYFLAITVFLLEFFYALVDPRVRLGAQGITVRPVREPRWRRFLAWLKGLMRPERVSLPPSRRVEANHRPGLGRSLRGIPASLRGWYQGLQPTLRELFRYRYARIGFFMIVALFGLAIYAVIAFPYSRAVELWRGNTGDFSSNAWYKNPEYAPPAWINLFRLKKLPETISLDSRKGDAQKERRRVSDSSEEIKLPFRFEYTADAFPQDLVLFITTKYQEKVPFVTVIWRTPDGREIDLGGHKASSFESYYLSREERLKRKLGSSNIVEGLFGDPNASVPTPLKGTYEMELSGFTFEPDGDVDAEVVVYGLVHGAAGTDDARRDLSLALLWGLPVALVFGLLGAIGTSLLAMSLAAIGVWYSGWVDDLIQRLSELSMILPVFPIVIMVYLLFSKSIWVILAVVVLLNTFSSGIKNYRAAFLQIRDAPYIEAARTYGTQSWRLIRSYMVPYIMPVLVPQIVILIPVFVFFEATLAFLGVFDPYIPTWGKVIYDALIIGDLQRYPYWFLEPVAMLMITALAFSLLGIGLERVLNPRLRTD